MFLAIYDGENFNAANFSDALLITLFSMLLVFLILALLMFIISLLNYTRPAKPVPKEMNWEELDEDARVAALVATVDYAEETKQDVRLVSVKKITKEGRK